MTNSGLTYIFTGDGKGKTSAALGVAMRAVGHGKRVAMVQWYKEKKWKIGEHNLPLMLKRTNKTIGSFEIYPMGRGFYKLPTDHAGEEEHRLAANKALKLAGKLLSINQQSTINNQQLFLLVLDEVINAVNDRLLALPALLNLLALRGSTHIILTGRNAPEKLIKIAALVTEMKNIKHPYDKGQKAVLGLDF